MLGAGLRFGVAIFLALSLAACATLGNRKLADLDLLQAEALTAQDAGGQTGIAARLGKPQSEIVFSDGGRVWVYSYVRQTPKWQNFTNVGFLFKAQSNYAKEFVVYFDRTGVVRKWRLSENSAEEKTGLAYQLARKPRDEATLAPDARDRGAQ
ncbi:hypothetical protein GCM10011289_26780 [Paludibacterium paludis]|uniref:Beta-barrel assembly machine subunit BamE n=1 Tax=Paludibacterium paludis TaxID=1225769 RepID=A0A918P4E4_9NEIS|nr:hypothetical protein GCM10011289_26780 [Paludibacterium paludis]